MRKFIHFVSDIVFISTAILCVSASCYRMLHYWFQTDNNDTFLRYYLLFACILFIAYIVKKATERKETSYWLVFYGDGKLLYTKHFMCESENFSFQEFHKCTPNAASIISFQRLTKHQYEETIIIQSEKWRE